MSPLDFLTTSFELFVIALFLVSVVAGIFGAMLGLGGGVIIVPVLTLGFGINIHYAIGASIISVIATSSGAAATYVRDRLTNIRLAMLLEVATTAGALIGAILSTHVAERYLFLVFAAILIYSVWIMFKKGRDSSLPIEKSDYWSKRLKLASVYPDHARNENIPYGVKGVPLGFLLMGGAGVISGLLGIGSGALKVPAMDSVMHVPLKVSTATSNFMIGVTASASAGAYYMHNDIIPILAAPVAVGVLVGSWLGTRIMMRLHSRAIRIVFMVFLLIIALQMILNAFGVRVR